MPQTNFLQKRAFFYVEPHNRGFAVYGRRNADPSSIDWDIWFRTPHRETANTVCDALQDAQNLGYESARIAIARRAAAV